MMLPQLVCTMFQHVLCLTTACSTHLDNNGCIDAFAMFENIGMAPVPHATVIPLLFDAIPHGLAGSRALMLLCAWVVAWWCCGEDVNVHVIVNVTVTVAVAADWIQIVGHIIRDVKIELGAVLVCFGMSDTDEGLRRQEWTESACTAKMAVMMTRMAEVRQQRRGGSPPRRIEMFAIVSCALCLVSGVCDVVVVSE